tara:strand:- start:586 stop:705 length:120 start_codon:yes stop_codon:yes gene_type:complete
MLINKIENKIYGVKTKKSKSEDRRLILSAPIKAIIKIDK